jgi:hypothetical protein
VVEMGRQQCAALIAPYTLPGKGRRFSDLDAVTGLPI